jgi:hypothetical protein
MRAALADLCGQFFEDATDGLGRQRPAEEVALVAITAHFCEPRELDFGLDTLRGHR